MKEWIVEGDACEGRFLGSFASAAAGEGRGQVAWALRYDDEEGRRASAAIPYSPFMAKPVEEADLPELNRSLIAHVANIVKLWKDGSSEGKEVAPPRQDPLRAGRLRWDGATFVLEVGADTELLVVGDLHGCYNNFIAILEQSDFCARVEGGEDVFLVFLGDFFDRGLRTIEGILPTLFALIEKYPGRVLPLQGNHELVLPARGGGIQPYSSPSDTWDFWAGHLSAEALGALGQFFNKAVPLMLFCSNGVVVSHAGIPDDDFVAGMKGVEDLARLEGARALSPTALNILWTDPAEGPFYRIRNPIHSPFGTRQFDAFMGKVGATLLVRGHEAKADGVEFTYPGRLVTVFSAGGALNPDAGGSYPRVRPRYLRIRGRELVASAIRWDS